MYGTAPDEPDALSVRSGFLAHRRKLVPVESISEIDLRGRRIELSVERQTLRAFL